MTYKLLNTCVVFFYLFHIIYFCTGVGSKTGFWGRCLALFWQFVLLRARNSVNGMCGTRMPRGIRVRGMEGVFVWKHTVVPKRSKMEFTVCTVGTQDTEGLLCTVLLLSKKKVQAGQRWAECVRHRQCALGSIWTKI